jgi:hypothetical protein
VRLKYKLPVPNLYQVRDFLLSADFPLLSIGIILKPNPLEYE